MSLILQNLSWLLKIALRKIRGEKKGLFAFWKIQIKQFKKEKFIKNKQEQKESKGMAGKEEDISLDDYAKLEKNTEYKGNNGN